MALNNIIAPRQSVVTSKGQPVAGGFVFLYEPGTTTFITAYAGSDLVAQLPQPIRLSGSGRANIWITRDADMVITDRLGNTVLTEDSINPDSLGSDSQSGLVPNGSFEIETTPPLPDGWVAINEAGATNAVDSTESTDGQNSYRFTSAGVGGGSLTTQDFFPVNDSDPLRVNFDLFSTVATVLNIVRVEWYDVTQLPISNTDVYSSTANPTSWTEFQLQAIPPALARFAKLRLIGVDPSVPLAGSTYFDRIQVFYPTVVSGVFDNITIQNNEIISTNLNGEITLQPNGFGILEMWGGGETVLLTSDFGDGIEIRDFNTDLPTVPGGAYEGIIRFKNFGGVNEMGVVGWVAGDYGMKIENYCYGGTVELFATPTTGGTRPVFIGDPDNETVLVHGPDSTRRIETASFGAAIKGGSGGGADTANRYISLQRTDTSGVRGQIGHNPGPSMRFANLIDSGNVIMQATNATSQLRTVITGNPDGKVSLFDPVGNVVRMAIDLLGALEIRSNGNTDVEGRFIEFTHQDATIRARLGHLSSSSFVVRNEINGGSMFIQGTNTGGATRDMIIGDPDTSLDFYYPATPAKRAACLASGIFGVYGDTNTDVVTRFVAFYWANGTRRSFMGNNGTVLEMRNEIDGGDVQIRGTEVGGTLRLGYQFLPASGAASSTHRFYIAGADKVRINEEGIADIGVSMRIVDPGGTLRPVGMNIMPIAEVDVNNVISDLDRVGYLYHKDSGTPTYTVDQESTTPVGATWVIANEAGGNITLLAGTGVTLRWYDGATGAVTSKAAGTSFTLGTGAVVTLFKYADLEYWIWGAGIS